MLQTPTFSPSGEEVTRAMCPFPDPPFTVKDEHQFGGGGTMTAIEAAAHLGVSRVRVSQLVKAGRIRVVEMSPVGDGHRMRMMLAREDVERYGVERRGAARAA